MSETTTGVPATGGDSAGTGTWVYAVTSAGSGDQPWPTGVAGREVYRVRAGGFEALVSEVDIAEFGEEALRRNLEDLDWLEAVARAHHRVIEAASATGPVVPMRLATVYMGDDRVASMLVERNADLQAALERVSGRVEWGVKAYLVHTAGAALTEPSQLRASADSPESTGTAYLRRRREQLTADEDRRDAAARTAELVYAQLTQCAEASELHPPQDSRLSGRSDRMIMNATYLVPRHNGDDFAQAVSDVADRCSAVRLELTGPWPPYSFATARAVPAASPRRSVP